MPTAVRSLIARIGLDDRDYQRGLTAADRLFDAFTRRAGTSAQALAGTLDRQTTQATRRLGDTLSQAGASGRKAFGLLESGAQASTRALRVMESAGGASLRAVTAGVGKVHSAFSGLSSLIHGPLLAGLGALGAVAGAGAVGAGLGSMAKRGLEFNESLAQVRNSLEIMLGSGQAASAVLSQLQKDAANTTFEFGGLAEKTKQLLAFGFNPEEARATLLGLGDVAFGMSGPGGANEMLDRLVRAMGQIRAKGVMQGDEAMQLTEAGVPVREILGVPTGTDIADMGLTADQAIPKLLAGLQAKFGGTMAKMMQSPAGIRSNIGDSMDAITSQATGGLGGSIQQFLAAALAGLQQMLNSQPIMAAITSLFDAMGKAVERVAAAIPFVVAGLERLATEDNVRMFLLNVTALVETLAQKFLEFFGVQLPDLMDPEAAAKFFEMMEMGVANTINAFFGMGRVVDEIGLIIKDMFNRVADYSEDISNRIGFAVGAIFARVSLGFVEVQVVALRSLADTLDAINAAIRSNPITSRLMGGINTAGIRGALGQANVARGGALQALDEAVFRSEMYPVYQSRREARRQMEDPNRGKSFGDRIGAAFAGSPFSDTRAQDKFWRQFEQNRRGLAGFFFGGTGTPAPAGGPQVFGGTPRIPASVTSYAQPPFDIPGYSTGGGGYDFSPVTLPNGQVVSAYAAMMSGQSGGGIGGGEVNFNIPITIDGNVDLNDPDLRRRLYDEIDARLDYWAGSE